MTLEELYANEIRRLSRNNLRLTFCCIYLFIFMILAIVIR